MADDSEFCTFATWRDVLVHIQAGRPIYYHAPLDVRPVAVRCQLTKGNKVRVFPPTADADPFTADSAHRARFCFRVPR
jgi:hypothetical protein